MPLARPPMTLSGTLKWSTDLSNGVQPPRK